jgi:GAF domain-containing protein
VTEVGTGADDARVESRFLLALELGRDVTARHDLSDVLNVSLTGLRRLVTFGGGSIQLMDDDGWISMAASDPPAPDDVMALRIPLGSTVGGRVILTERPVYLPDIADEGSIPKANLSPGGVRSYLGVPLPGEGRALGLLQIDSPEIDAWSAEDQLVVICVAPIIAAAIQNARAAARESAMDARARRLDGRRAIYTAIVDNDIAPRLADLARRLGGEATTAEFERLVDAIEGLRSALDTSSQDLEGRDDPSPFHPPRGSEGVPSEGRTIDLRPDSIHANDGSDAP